jgi:tetratricopeptide (TPR) repeat protein
MDRRRELGDRIGVARAIGLLGQALIPAHIDVALELLEPASIEFADLGDAAELAMIEHQLARANWLSGDIGPAVVLADRAIGRAERIDNLPLIADAMITKGSLISGTRSHEGMALLRTGQQLAEANGLTSISVRGLLNIGASAYGVDPRAAQDVGRETVVIARRLGLRSQLATAAGNSLEGAVQVGEWEWAEEEAARLLDEDLEAADRFAVYRGIEELRAYKGEFVEDMLAQHRAHIEDTGGNTNISNYEGALAAHRFVEGDYPGAVAAWLKSAELNSTNTPSDLPHAIRAALWAGDRATLDKLIAQYEELHVHGPAPTAWRLTVAAALAAFDGRRDDAVAQYADARARWAEIGVVFEGSLVGIDMVLTLGPNDPAAQAAAAETRATLARLGAKPFLALIDRLMASAAESVGPSARPEARDEVKAAVEQ